MRRIALAGMLAGALLIAGGLPAGAHVQVIEDPNDTPGKLDIKKAKLNHEGDKVTLFLRTYDRWSKRALRHLSGGGTKGTISFQFKNGPESSVMVNINRKDDGKLWAVIVLCNTNQCFYNQAKMRRAYRPDRRSVKTTLKREFLPARSTLRWRATTAFGTRCDGHCHFDVAPKPPKLAEHEVGP